MTRRRGFWAVFIVLTAASVLAALRLFPAAFPIVSLDLAMDRETAVAEAEAIALRYGWDPPDARTAATFGQTDPEVQTYVELEAGGRDAFVGLAERGIYHPYVWTVRRFAEGAVEESRVRFTPAGEPYGFGLRLSEEDPGGGNVPEAAARSVAEEAASEWGVDLASFELLETSEERQPGGRVDHTFVFERTGAAVGEGRFRLRIRVAGNRPSELAHFVYVPEAFSQRFADMRSANDAIALASQSVFIVLFILVGGGVGTALLLRRRWVVWRPPLAWGAVTALLLGLGIANTLPLTWMDYDPAVSTGTFLAGQLGLAAAVVVVGTPLLAFVYLAAESLGRRAFPGHLQQWKFWSPDVAASVPAVGRTAGAYLLAGLQVGYVVLFYLAISRLDGWWTPAEAVVQPDLLATPQPWILAVSTSLFAAFWEESAFRAIPIACAALLGARYGRTSLWIWGAVVLQAVVFAAGHANYPQQPAYARVVELSAPALLWGVTYLHFGLVPTILAHFTYNLSLISLPLFTSAAPGILLDRAAVVAAGLVPVLVVLLARWRVGARADAPEWAYNRAWNPPPQSVEATARLPGPPPRAGLHAGMRRLPGRRRLVYTAGAVGALAWVAAALVPAGDAPGLGVSRGEAIAGALGALEARGDAAASWRVLASVASDRGDDHRYVFEEAGEEAYGRLLGSYLAEPRWAVRFVDFAAAPEDRVEEFRVELGPGGESLGVEHTLPEARPGASLSEGDARAVALAALETQFGVEAGSVEEIGAVQTARPARTDWRFTFGDPSVLAEIAGEAELAVALAGDEVVEIVRSVSVPEEWELARREGEALWDLVVAAAGFGLLLAFGAAAVLGVVAWARHGLDTGLLLRAGLLAAAAVALGQANAWPATEAFFSPEQPWSLQAGIAVFGNVIVVLLSSAALALTIALAHRWLGAGGGMGETSSWRLAVSFGAAIAGLGALAGRIPGGLPPWQEVSGAVSFIPAFASPLQATSQYLVATTGLLLLSGLALKSAARPRLLVPLCLLALASGLLLAPAPLQGSAPSWVAGAIVAGGVVFALARLGAGTPALIPPIVGTVLSAGLLVEVLTGPYPGAGLGGALALSVVAGLSAVWARELGSAEAG
ncbi:MAG: type II CAAX endopeptidase family protein [Gammaproteobacteria bacterium]|nr:type II CAAX endopeptidase family protein [Gammaproteobacteria bacterium]MDE0249106.1 type II CAAX endopeptidase family protein [Gammaproteobacteria bacterium]